MQSVRSQTQAFCGSAAGPMPAPQRALRYRLHGQGFSTVNQLQRLSHRRKTANLHSQRAGKCANGNHPTAVPLFFNLRRLKLKKHLPAIAILSAACLFLTVAGCAVSRGQETVGAYIDDASITTVIKSKFVENREVDASSISVETLRGAVMLSGFAKNQTEKATAENIARNVKGVKSVQNQLVVRP